MSALSICSPFTPGLGNASGRCFPKANRKETPVVVCVSTQSSLNAQGKRELPATRRSFVGHAAISVAAAFLWSGLTSAAAEASPSAALLPPSGGSGAIASSTSAARQLMVLVGGMTAGVGMFLAPQLSESLRRGRGASSAADAIAVRMELELPTLACEERAMPPACVDMRASLPPAQPGAGDREPSGGGGQESPPDNASGGASKGGMHQDPLARIHVSIDEIERRAAEVHAMKEVLELGTARADGATWHVPKSKLVDAAMRVAELRALVKQVGHGLHAAPSPKRVLETGLWTREEIAAVDPEIYQDFVERLAAVEVLRVQVAAERAELEALELEAGESSVATGAEGREAADVNGTTVAAGDATLEEGTVGRPEVNGEAQVVGESMQRAKPSL